MISATLKALLRRTRHPRQTPFSTTPPPPTTSHFLASRWPQLAPALTSQRTVPPEVAMAVIKESFEQLGKEPYFGEPVTHEEHALQCATLAEQAGMPTDVVVAAFLHDIGHICASDDAPHMNTDGGPDVGVVDHETVGRELLQVLGFSSYVTELVESHVPSKRYLVSVDKEYERNLAQDSRRSLTFQGGVMSSEEVVEFDNLSKETKALYLQFREWDEQGKQPGVDTKPIEHYYPMVERHLRRNCGAER